MNHPTRIRFESIMLSTAYLPPLEYIWLLTQTASAVIEVHETYPKQTWRNRCRIMTSNGAHNLTVPVIKPFGNQTKTFEVVASNHLPWQKTHWQTLLAAYASAPYFIYYRDLVEPLFSRPFSGKLVDWNSSLLRPIISALKIPVNLTLSEQFINPRKTRSDFRYAISPKTKDNDHDWDALWPEYRQVFADKEKFIPNLSIIDLLFCLGPDATDYLSRHTLDQYHSIEG